MRATELFHEFIDYEHEAIQKMLDDLSEEELEIEMSEKHTVRGRLLHMSEAEFRMAGYLWQPETEEEYQRNDTANVQQLKQLFVQSQARHHQTIENLSEDDWQKTWTSKVSGNSYAYKFLLWHFLEHLATHRGQVAMAIRQARDQ